MRRYLLLACTLSATACITPPESSMPAAVEDMAQSDGLSVLDSGLRADGAVDLAGVDVGGMDAWSVDFSTLDAAPVTQDLGNDTGVSTDLGEQQTGEALLVVGDADVVDASDMVAFDLLVTAGFSPAFISDEIVVGTDVSAYDLVVVSKSSSSSVLGASLSATPTPLMLWENRSLYQDWFGLISTTSVEYFSWTTFATTVWIGSAAAAATAGGLAGEINLYSSALAIWYVPEAVLGPGAEIVARLSQGSSDVFAFVYESGAMRPDGSASPGRRVYIGLDTYNVDTLGADGRTLFISLARWAAR